MSTTPGVTCAAVAAVVPPETALLLEPLFELLEPLPELLEPLPELLGASVAGRLAELLLEGLLEGQTTRAMMPPASAARKTAARPASAKRIDGRRGPGEADAPGARASRDRRE